METNSDRLPKRWLVQGRAKSGRARALFYKKNYIENQTILKKHQDHRIRLPMRISNECEGRARAIVTHTSLVAKITGLETVIDAIFGDTRQSLKLRWCTTELGKACEDAKKMPPHVDLLRPFAACHTI